MISGTDPDLIRSELLAVGAGLQEAATFVLIGGCNLAIRRIKSSTKDVDLLVMGPAAPEGILQAFVLAGFEVVDGYYLPGAPLDPHTMLENKRGTWIDLFLPDHLFGGLGYSAHMAQREDPWFAEGKLRCHLADPTAVFLLKAVTGRWRSDPTRDIPDLQDLIDRGLVDWPFLQAEWDRQLAHHPRTDTLRTLAREALGHLADLGYRRIAWRP